MRLQDILSLLPFYETEANIDRLNINSIEIDHRLIKQGDLFICQRGFTFVGHEFAQQAVDNGACAVVADHPLNISTPVIIVRYTNRALSLIAAIFYDYLSAKLPLIGVTDTNGKPTNTHLLDAIFKQIKKKTGLLSTSQIKIGQETHPVKNTTPDPLQLQQAVHLMYNTQVHIAIMEVSS